jgi:hypothetical protein
VVTGKLFVDAGVETGVDVGVVRGAFAAVEGGSKGISPLLADWLPKLDGSLSRDSKSKRGAISRFWSPLSPALVTGSTAERDGRPEDQR